MQFKSLVALFAVATAVAASPLHYPRQGAPHTPSGKPPGTQFITGNCSSDGDCESTCCDPVKGTCAAKLVAQEDGDNCTGDGGAATAPVASSAAVVSSAAIVVASATGTSSAAASTGTQFITGPCGGDGDCASGCCDAVKGLCAARLVAEQDGDGCGFDGSAAAPVASSAAASVAGTSAAPASTFASSGKPAGTQFITGNCAATSECASNCCDAHTGLCAALDVAEEDGHGCLAQ